MNINANHLDTPFKHDFEGKTLIRKSDPFFIYRHQLWRVIDACISLSNHSICFLHPKKKTCFYRLFAHYFRVQFIVKPKEREKKKINRFFGIIIIKSHSHTEMHVFFRLWYTHFVWFVQICKRDVICIMKIGKWIQVRCAKIYWCAIDFGLGTHHRTEVPCESSWEPVYVVVFFCQANLDYANQYGHDTNPFPYASNSFSILGLEI